MFDMKNLTRLKKLDENAPVRHLESKRLCVIQEGDLLPKNPEFVSEFSSNG